MDYDYSYLRGKIREKGISESEFSKKIGVGVATFSGRINNKSCFSQNEMWLACKELSIPISEIHKYFFTPILLKTEV